MRLVCLAVLLAGSSLAGSVLAGCDLAGDPPATTPKAIDLTPQARVLVRQSSAFGVRLYARVAAGEPGNLMLSPLSASVALTMLLNGADGDTYAQIRDMLGYAPEQDLASANESYRSLREQLLAADPQVAFSLANSVFYDVRYDSLSPFKAPFLAAMRESFDASVGSLDFAAPASVGVVNRWASDHTAGRVPRVIDRIDPGDVMFLMNALSFKGDWSTPFDLAATRPGPFELAGGGTVQAPMMNGEVPALLVQGDGYAALELPYGRRNFSFVALLPDDPATPLATFAERLEAGLWTDATTRLDAKDAAQSEWGDVLVALPKLSFSFKKVLNDQLQALGMRDAFTDGVANLSRMNADRRLFVTAVQQNAFLHVDEKGTEAAAVTRVEVGVVSLGPHFFATRPFVFGIRERSTNTLLFIGQVANPGA